jgi:outer membrane protein assembly factor BamB
MCLEFDDVKQPPRVRWEDRDVGRTQSNASVKDGLVYVSDFAGFLNCWDAETGEVIYKFDIGASVKERSQLITDGKIYVSNDRNELYVITEGREPELISTTRFRKHLATVEVADNLLLAVTAQAAYLYHAMPGSNQEASNP